MALLRAGGLYIWVTWLTKLLSDENSCEWAAWFRSPANCPPLAVSPLHLASRNYRKGETVLYPISHPPLDFGSDQGVPI